MAAKRKAATQTRKKTLKEKELEHHHGVSFDKFSQTVELLYHAAFLFGVFMMMAAPHIANNPLDHHV